MTKEEKIINKALKWRHPAKGDYYENDLFIIKFDWRNRRIVRKCDNKVVFKEGCIHHNLNDFKRVAMTLAGQL